MSIIREKMTELIQNICDRKIEGEGGAICDLLNQTPADQKEVEELDEKLGQLLQNAMKNRDAVDEEKLYDEMNAIMEKKQQLMGITGYGMIYDTAIPVWESTMDYFKINVPVMEYREYIVEKADEIIKTVELIHDSQEKIIEALERDNPEGMKGFRPVKVSSVLFDYTGEKPEFSFYVESNDEYHFHVYIKEDLTFDAGYIS